MVAPQRTGVIQRVLSIQGYDQSLPLEARARSFHLCMVTQPHSDVP